MAANGFEQEPHTPKDARLSSLEKRLDRVKADLAPLAKVEMDARFEGRQMIMILAPR